MLCKYVQHKSAIDQDIDFISMCLPSVYLKETRSQFGIGLGCSGQWVLQSQDDRAYCLYIMVSVTVHHFFVGGGSRQSKEYAWGIQVRDWGVSNLGLGETETMGRDFSRWTWDLRPHSFQTQNHFHTSAVLQMYTSGAWYYLKSPVV